MASIDDGHSVGGGRVNALADISTARHLSVAIEDAEAKRLGISVLRARPSIARRLGVSPGTLENIRRIRVKKIPNWLMARIRSEFVAMLQAEVRRLDHEITLCLQAGEGPHSDVLAQAQAHVASVKELLRSAGRGRP